MEILRLLAVYGGSCALVLWLVHRTLRPVTLPVAVVLALLPFAFTGRAMLSAGVWGGLNLAYATPPLSAFRDQLPEQSYDNGILMDQVCQVIPWRKAVRESVKNGRWPLWNRFSRGGDILLGHSQPAPFDPKVWLGFLLPLATALTFACSFVFFQAACFTWLYLRELGLGDGAALVGGAVYMSSQFLTFWVGWSMSSVWAVMPLLLFGVHRLAHGTRGGFGTTVVAATLALVGGHPESVLHISTVALVVLLVEWPYGDSFKRRLPRLRRTLLAGLAAGALAAPAVLPFVEALVQTADFKYRQHNSHHNASLPMGEAMASAIGVVFPWAWGRPRHDDVVGKPKAFEAAAGAHVGGAAMMLALVGLVSGRRRRWLFGGLATIAFGLSVGLPGLTEVFASLPLFDITLNSRFTAVTAFSLGVFAAFGAQKLLDGSLMNVGDHQRARWVLGLGATVVAVAAFLHLAQADLTESADHLFLRSLVGTLVPCVLLALWSRVAPIRPGRLGSAALVLLVLVPRAIEIPDFYRTFSSRVFYPSIPDFEALPDFQRDGGEPYRVTGLYSDLVPGQSALWELEDPRGYQVMRHARQKRTLSLWCNAPDAWWFCRVLDPSVPFLSALNVRYAVGAPNRNEAADWALVARGRHATLWENPRVLPRAFAPQTVLRIDPDAKPPAAIRLLDDFARAAVIEFNAWSETEAAEPVLGHEQNLNYRTNAAAQVRTRADGPDLTIDVDTPAPAWIVVSETPWRGWHATDQDGRRLELTFANISMLAFRAPAGTSRVLLEYRPASFTVGLALAALALTGLGTALVRAALRRHRTRIRRGRPVYSTT